MLRSSLHNLPRTLSALVKILLLKTLKLVNYQTDLCFDVFNITNLSKEI